MSVINFKIMIMTSLVAGNIYNAVDDFPPGFAPFKSADSDKGPFVSCVSFSLYFVHHHDDHDHAMENLLDHHHYLLFDFYNT